MRIPRFWASRGHFSTSRGQIRTPQAISCLGHQVSCKTDGIEAESRSFLVLSLQGPFRHLSRPDSDSPGDFMPNELGFMQNGTN